MMLAQPTRSRPLERVSWQRTIFGKQRLDAAGDYGLEQLDPTCNWLTRIELVILGKPTNAHKFSKVLHVGR